jgi:hypothetical protein
MQVDSTEGFGDGDRLGADEWMSTRPLNSTVPNPEAMGLPPVGASPNEVTRIASALSRVRESVGSEDAVYCPRCHIATTTLDRLRAPCPQCGGELLQFGWT